MITGLNFLGEGEYGISKNMDLIKLLSKLIGVLVSFFSRCESNSLDFFPKVFQGHDLSQS